jgi:hypothetical protein|tara:strand:+ start:1596 stop:1874 length:279 start_codon:yes stop_codon:yes gene_type:complete
MKLDTDDKIAFIAIVIGLAQMMMHFNRVYNADDLSYYSIQYVVAGISASLLWIIYQYRKGANFSVLYSTAGLLLGMYTLQRVLKERKDKKLE